MSMKQIMAKNNEPQTSFPPMSSLLDSIYPQPTFLSTLIVNYFNLVRFIYNQTRIFLFAHSELVRFSRFL